VKVVGRTDLLRKSSLMPKNYNVGGFRAC
jgi:hypothetical protein